MHAVRGSSRSWEAGCPKRGCDRSRTTVAAAAATTAAAAASTTSTALRGSAVTVGAVTSQMAGFAARVARAVATTPRSARRFVVVVG
jgi:type IV secretory pathway TrbL component